MSRPVASRAWVLLALVLGLLGLAAAPASAHATLVSTNPADGSLLAGAPAAVRLVFDEPVTVVAGATNLYDATGRRVPASVTSPGSTVEVRPSSTLGRGTFVLAYRVLSDDGHPVTGSLTFSVDRASRDVAAPTPPPADTAVETAQGVLNGLLYLGLLAGAGLAAFAAVLLPRGRAAAGARRRVRAASQAASLLAVLAATLRIPVVGLYRTGGRLDEALSPDAWSPWAGADGALVVLVVGGLAIAASAPTMEGTDRARATLTCLGAGVAVVTPVLTGHTRSYGPTVLVMGADAVHLLAAAGWLGGLVGLALTVHPFEGREELVATTVARFSGAAVLLLAALVPAGTVMALRILGSWSDLVDTTYGVLLLVKVVVVAVVVGVAAWNRFRLLPAVLEAIDHDRRRTGTRRLRSALLLEVTGLVAVLAVTGFLVDQVPRPSTTSASSATQPLGALRLQPLQQVCPTSPASKVSLSASTV